MQMPRSPGWAVRLPLLTCLLLWCVGPLLQGCDVVLVVVALEQSRSKSKDAAPASTPAPNVSFSVYVANLASPTAAATEANNLDSNGGNPSVAVWTPLGQGNATITFPGIAGTVNAVLIQGPLTQAYNIDAFESLDVNGAVVEVPTLANVYSNSTVTNKTNAGKMLDGKAALTVISDPTHIPCIFALFTQPITSVRIRIWGANQAPGDCVWAGNQELTNSIVVGGAAADSSGNVYTTFVDTAASPAPQSWLLPFGPTGTPGSLISVSTSASTSGGISSAVDSSGSLFVASALSTGNVLLQKYAGAGPAPQWAPATYVGSAGGGANTIGPRSLAVASNVPLIVNPLASGSAIFIAGSQGTTGTHTLARFDDNTTTGALVWGPKTLADPSSKPTAWSGVATLGATDVLTTGNLTNSTSGNVEILTADSAISSGTVSWPTSVPIPTTGGGTATNNGNAIGADGQGFAYVAGNFGSATNGKDSVLLRYKVSDGSGLTTMYHNGVSSGSLAFAGANEFMDVAVDTDGTTYAVGYITQTNLVSTTATGSVTSWWIGKFSPTGLVPLWTATFNFGTGSDRALSVSISGNFIYVVGSEAVPAGAGTKLGLKVFKFVR